MRISPLHLAHPAYGMPEFSGTLLVRSPDLQKSECEVTWMESFALAIRGEIEAVATSAGRIKYFRRLRDDERPEPTKSVDALDHTTSRSGVVAQTNLGVYRQEVRTVVGTEEGYGPDGKPTPVEIYEVIGHVYAFSMLRACEHG